MNERINNKEYKKLYPFKGWVLENFPFIEADFDAITNYELICKVVEYLNKMSSQFNMMIENLDYINNWLSTLDLQDEVNNKLDEMAEDGTLQEIITDYLNSKAIFAFDTVADMKEATNLINGSYTKTLGYNTKNDGGSSLYFVREVLNTDVVDEKKIIALYDNNLIAEIVTPDKISPQIFGAIGDGIEDDTTILSYILTNYNNLYLPENKTYKISTINVPAKDIVIDGNGKLLVTGTGLQFNAPSNTKVIEDINIELDGGTVGLGFHGDSVTTPYNTLTISNVKVKATNLSGKIGIDIQSENEALISNLSLYGCQLNLIGSINPSLVNCVFRHSAIGIYYANETSGREAYACGLKVLNTTILGCTIGIKSVQTDSLQIENSMIDYDDYPIIILGTGEPVINNCFISSRSGNPAVYIAKNNSDSGVFGGNGLSTEVTPDAKILNSYILQHDEALTNSTIIIKNGEHHVLKNLTIPYSGKAGIEIHDVAYTTIASCSIRGSFTSDSKAILSYKSDALNDDSTNYYSDIATRFPIYVRYARTNISTHTFRTMNSGSVVVPAGTTSKEIDTLIPQGVNYAIVTCSLAENISYSTTGSKINVVIPTTTNNFRLNWIAYGNTTHSSF